MNTKETTAFYFLNGFNRSQAIFAAFAPDFGMSEELALKLSSNFGGGARCGQLCGAVSGAMMVLGLKYGFCRLDEVDQISKANDITIRFQTRFCERNRSVVCKDLLGYDLSVPERKAEAKTKGLFKEICPRMVSDAVEILEQLLAED